MNKAPIPGGLAEQHSDIDTLTVPRAAGIVMTRNARRIRLHHVLVRRRRWSKELDRLLAADPWSYAEARRSP